MGAFSLSPQQVLTAEPFHTPLGQRTAGSPGPSSKMEHSFQGDQKHPGGLAPSYISHRLAGPPLMYSVSLSLPDLRN